MSVGDNSPVVTGISPSDWNSGTTTPVTISGQYFGTNAPTLSFSPGSGISYALTGYSDTQITANVSVAASTPNETVAVTVTANGYNGSGFQSNGNGQGAQSSSVTAAVHAKMNYTDITVVGWVNASAITLPTGENASLQYDLNYAAGCAYDVIMWSQGKRTDLNNTTTDPAYASAYLLQHSGNTAPPSTITPSSFGQNKNNYRLFNDFGSPAGGTIQVGNTPNPCSTGVIANWTSAAGESSPYAGTGTSSSGQAYQLAEGRLGTTGQKVNQTLNGVSTPFIWSTIEFTAAGVPTYSDVAMFPTYSVYKNGALVATYPQSSATAFNAQSASYQRLPSQIP